MRMPATRFTALLPLAGGSLHRFLISFALILAVTCALSAQAAAIATELRFVSYNLLNNPQDEAADSELTRVVTAIAALQQPDGIAARAPDLIALVETDLISAARFGDLMNALYPDAFYLYETAPADFGDDRTGFLYNQDSLTLSDTQVITGITHPALQGRFSTPSGAEFLAFAVHLKAGAYPENQAIRADETRQLRQHLVDAQQAAGNLPIWLAGDLNLNGASETAWWNLTQAGAAQLFDPVNAEGDWKDNLAYITLHSQDPRGPLDDRYDFQLVSAEWFDSEGLEHVAGSYRVLANNGSHTLNQAIDTGTGASAEVLAALIAFSDHLPVVADFRVLPTQPTHLCTTAAASYSGTPPASTLESELAITLRDMQLTDQALVLRAPSIRLEPAFQAGPPGQFQAVAQAVVCGNQP